MVLNVIDLYPTILESLDAIGDVSKERGDKNKAESLTYSLMSFDFVFVAFLMISVFGIENTFDASLQLMDRNLANAISVVDICKKLLQELRDDGWDSHMDTVTSFMVKHGVEIPNMEGMYVAPRRRKYGCGMPQVANLHHFRVEVFESVIDQQLQELENRFDEVNKELLICMSCFDPINRFSSFDKIKLLRLAKFYPNEFSNVDLLNFEQALGNFIDDIQNDERFWEVKNLNELSIKLVEATKNEAHSKVYMLLKLVLLLPVAMANVERACFGMNFVKNKLRNSAGDQVLSDCLVTTLEKDLFVDVSIDAIVNQFENMRTQLEVLEQL